MSRSLAPLQEHHSCLVIGFGTAENSEMQGCSGENKNSLMLQVTGVLSNGRRNSIATGGKRTLLPRSMVALETSSCNIFSRFSVVRAIDVQLRDLEEQLGHHFVPFTRDEVVSAVNGGVNRKCTGPEGVPQELLKAICQIDEGLDALCAFFSGVLETSQHPEGWCKSLMSLLPKKLVLTSAKDLRPICVTSHLSKTFTKLVTQRIIHTVTPDTPFQCCAPKRQTADYIWSVNRVMQLSYERGVPVCAIKLDLEKAFDRLDRRALGELLVEELGGDFPTEVRNLLAMLMQGEATIPTVWGDGSTLINIGVRQGGVESATLFSWVVSKLLQRLQQKWEPVKWMPDGEIEQQAFVEDTILWDSRTDNLQSKLVDLQGLLSKYGLRINIAKSSLVCHGGVGVQEVQLDGVTLRAFDHANEQWCVMGVPVHPGVNEGAQVAALIAKSKVQTLRPAKHFAVGSSSTEEVVDA